MKAAEVIALLGLEPLPVEGGLFRQTWRGPHDPVTKKPSGTAIVAMLTDEPDSFSAMHRLPTDEVWHFQLGDPIQLLLLYADGSIDRPVLGPDLPTAQRLTHVVAAGTWMGARLVPGGEFGVFGCTMAPGFVASDYEGAEAEDLCARYPDAADEVRALFRPHETRRRLPDGY